MKLRELNEVIKSDYIVDVYSNKTELFTESFHRNQRDRMEVYRDSEVTGIYAHTKYNMLVIVDID